MKSSLKFALLLWIIALLIPTIVCFYSFITNFDISILETLSLFYVFLVGFPLPIIMPELIEEKYGVDTKLKIVGTYQYITKMFLIWFITFMYLIFVGTHCCGYFSQGSLCSIFFIIPIIGAIINRNTFHDSSCNVGDEILFGYHPIYVVLSLIIGIFGFNFILNSNVNNNLVLIITLIFQAIMVMPNVINKIAPFEIRTKKGCIYFVASTIILYVMAIFLTVGNSMFYSTNGVINTRTILEKIITYSVGMILVYLFYKQAMKMNKKEK